LAQDVLEAGGEATVWLADPASATDGRALAETMARAIAQEYRAVIEHARQAQGAGPAMRRRALARLRSELRRIPARDYIPPPERQEAEAAVEALAARVEVTP